MDANENLFIGEGGDQCQVFIPGSCTTINTQVVEIPAANDYSQTNVLGPGVFGKPIDFSALKAEIDQRLAAHGVSA